MKKFNFFAVIILMTFAFVGCDLNEVNPTINESEITISDNHLFETGGANERSGWSSVITRTSNSMNASFLCNGNIGKQIMIGVKNNSSNGVMDVSVIGVSGPSSTTYYQLYPGETQTYTYTVTSSNSTNPRVNVRSNGTGQNKIVSYSYQY